MGRIILERLRERKFGGNTAFVIATFGYDHIIRAIVVTKDCFESGGWKAKLTWNVVIKTNPKKDTEEDGQKSKLDIM